MMDLKMRRFQEFQRLMGESAGLRYRRNAEGAEDVYLQAVDKILQIVSDTMLSRYPDDPPSIYEELRQELRQGFAEALRGQVPDLEITISGEFKRRQSIEQVPSKDIEIVEPKKPERSIDLPPDLWTAKERTRANLAAMNIAATKGIGMMSAKERRALALYSGWGGLSIEKVKDQLPPGFPHPEKRGLIHEYYTPSSVVKEVAKIVKGLLPKLPKESGQILTLEPSAGIGRFVQAASGKGFNALKWLVVEYSALSSQMLQAIRPDINVQHTSFEQWVAENAHLYAQKIGLVLSNPPYGKRSASITKDPNRSYREKKAYAYFLRRGLDLLARGGLGVYLIPIGFLTGQDTMTIDLRKKVLKRHHVLAAYRLPTKLFPGALSTTDLIFFEARGGELEEVLPEDQYILEGRYFKRHPENILGVEIEGEGYVDGKLIRPRWGYEIVGSFEGLPKFEPRPLVKGELADLPEEKASKAVQIGRQMEKTKGLSYVPSLAESFGIRVDRYLALFSAQTSDEHVQMWRELYDALVSFVKMYGNPYQIESLVDLAENKDSTPAQRFLAAFDKDGNLIEAIRRKPRWEPKLKAAKDDVIAIAEWAYRTFKRCSLQDLLKILETRSGMKREKAKKVLRDKLPSLLTSGWGIAGESMDLLFPEVDFYSGDLWKRYDQIDEWLKSNKDNKPLHVSVPVEMIKEQKRKILDAIDPKKFDEIEAVAPNQSWVPMQLRTQWIVETLNRGVEVEIVFEKGLFKLKNRPYEDILLEKELMSEAKNCIGWFNFDRTVFYPDKAYDEKIDEARVRVVKEWTLSFEEWLSSKKERRDLLEESYNRKFRGFVQPDYGGDPIKIARWSDEITLRHHQNAGARRVLANRGGLVAFDVGVGKTFTGIAIVAKARQEGWVRRPVILVPNSIVWNWVKEFKRTLPDYRIAVIGASRKIISRGERKGEIDSDTDTPAERAEKWTRFQAGEFEVVLLTYSMLNRTQMNEDEVRKYADSLASIQREVELQQRNLKKRGGDVEDLTERQKAILEEGVAAWVSLKMELPPGQIHDPGVAWDDLGIDMLVVDEAQNFKNLFEPGVREGGKPAFMGSSASSSRAWHLDFRCASIRRKTGGSGIVLLSATPAKNSPLEFYNLYNFLDPRIFADRGISNAEQFIERYLKLELKNVIESSLKMNKKSAVVGFQNLDELRDIIFRYGEFRTAEDVGLELPETKVNRIEVDMNVEQDEKYDFYLQDLLDSLKNPYGEDAKGRQLRAMAMMSAVSVHQALDEGFKWKNAKSYSGSVESPKFTACAKRIKANKNCGHIIFVQSTAAHWWMRETLVKHGIKKARIAIMNAKVASPQKRQTIAEKFNGSDKEKPAYDVVIANSVAYEGINLQRRTCEIHHIDLPWEPATLQQRNGRGVRQGNTESTVAINYYLARKSQDGFRFMTIHGKQGWMKALISSQDRDTNNPAAQQQMTAEQMLIMASRDPEATEKAIADARERERQERLQKKAKEAARILRAANSLQREAETTIDQDVAAQLRSDANERIEGVKERFDEESFPWSVYADRIRHEPVLFPEDGGPPFFEGQFYATSKEEGQMIFEVGKIDGNKAHRRKIDTSFWAEIPKGDIEARYKYDKELIDIPYPQEKDDIRSEMEGYILRLRNSGDFNILFWIGASARFLEAMWVLFGEELVKALRTPNWNQKNRQKIPVLEGKKIRIVNGYELKDPKLLNSVVPWTEGGYETFLNSLKASKMTYGDANQLSKYWWRRGLSQADYKFHTQGS